MTQRTYTNRRYLGALEKHRDKSLAQHMKALRAGATSPLKRTFTN
jgi:hypothetical protein